MNNKIYIVICRYTENIEWLRKINLPFVIYDKNDKSNNNFFSNTISIPNIGREEYVYIKYIIDNYDSLPDRIIFSQANPFYHSPDFINLVNLHDKFDDTQPLSYRYDHFVPGRQIQLCSRQFYLGNNRIHVDFFDKHLKRYYPPAKKTFHFPGGCDYTPSIVPAKTWYYFLQNNSEDIRKSMHDLIEIPTRQFHGLDITPMCYAGIFSTTKEKIYLKPKSYYENLFDICLSMHFNIEQKAFGWIMEYMWLELFDYRPSKEMLFSNI